MAAEQPRNIQPDVVAPRVQADWSPQQSLLGGDQEKPESHHLSARGDQQQCPSPRKWRLPLPKLRSLVRPRSTPEQRVESRSRTDLEEGSPSQMLQKVGHTPSTTSSNSAITTLFEQEDRKSSTASPGAHADSGNDKLGRKSVSKLNFFSRSGSGLFKRAKDKDSVDRQPQLPDVSDSVSCDSNQQVRLQLEEKLAQGIPSEGELQVRLGEGHLDVSQSSVYNQQDRASATVPTEAADQQDQLKVADQDCGKESDLEEGEFFDADCNDDVAGEDTVVGGGNEVEEEGQLEIDEREISEESLPATSSSSTPASPRITPGFLIELKLCNWFVFCRQETAATSQAEPGHGPQ